MKRKIRLTESDLHRIVKESVRKVINEATFDTPYGPVSNNPLKPTFDNEEEQNLFKNDIIDAISNADDKRFMIWWNKRMAYDDPDVVDAIYNEYYKRRQNGQINF